MAGVLVHVWCLGPHSLGLHAVPSPVPRACALPMGQAQQVPALYVTCPWGRPNKFLLFLCADEQRIARRHSLCASSPCHWLVSKLLLGARASPCSDSRLFLITRWSQDMPGSFSIPVRPLPWSWPASARMWGNPCLVLSPFLLRCGLTVSALNLLPVGSLDGGRAMQVCSDLKARAALHRRASWPLH